MIKTNSKTNKSLFFCSTRIQYRSYEILDKIHFNEFDDYGKSLKIEFSHINAKNRVITCIP